MGEIDEVHGAVAVVIADAEFVGPDVHAGAEDSRVAVEVAGRTKFHFVSLRGETEFHFVSLRGETKFHFVSLWGGAKFNFALPRRRAKRIFALPEIGITGIDGRRTG